MGFKKLTRIASARGWFVIALALVGAGIGYLLAQSSNGDRRPSFEARATVEIRAPESGRDRAAVEVDLTEAVEEAEAANEEALENGWGRISGDNQVGLLIFTTRAREESVASERASTMRSAYLDATAQGSADDRQERLDEIVTEAAGILAQLDELNPAPPEVEEPLVAEEEIDPEVAAQLDVLDSLITRLTQEHTKLEVDLILAETGDDRVGEPEEIQTELDAVSTRLDEVYAEIAQISADNNLTVTQVTERRSGGEGQAEGESETQPEQGSSQSGDPRDVTIPSEVQTPDELQSGWTVAALESRYEELAGEYESLFIEQETEEPAELTSVEVVDLTPSETDPRLNMALGFAIGAFVAFGLAVGEATLRGRVYVLADTTPLTGLAEFPAAGSLVGWRRRSRHVPPIERWRVASNSPRRTAGIHRVRIALIEFMETQSSTPVIGLTPSGVNHEETLMLATDLGTRLHASGRSVLVFDFALDDRSLSEGEGSSATLADLMAKAESDPEAAVAQAKSAFSEVATTMPLRVIPSGQLRADPADVVLSDEFTLVLDVAREQSNIVMIVAPEASNLVTVSLHRRLDGMIALAAVGRTRRGVLVELAGPGRGSTALGVVLLTKAEGRRILHQVGTIITWPFRWVRDKLFGSST